ncbi:transketolase [Chitinophaga sp. LS1]|uniref:transketolase n=1 Tax=Chitinophaga sp. LS1 TaxID=3051176 RepID=UPI002AABF353|nr:transketolase [Chitinophaga sp. LS1]WPV66557.1 transketolase [Chitinophaga sp. LS1]
MTDTSATVKSTSIDALSVNTIRFLSIDAVQKANSGHPGLPLGAAPMAYVLFNRIMRYNSSDPKWFNRDRFVLSAGHGSALLYSMLHLTGYDLSLDDLKHFRQIGSKTPGHPESMLTPGIEVTTGPLGQGLGNAIGIAMAEAHLAAKYNRPDHKIIDHFTYVIASDGDMMEGVASEASSLAGHLKLGKLICLYDDNKISLDGPTSLAFTEDVLKRYEAYDWHVQIVEDGNDLNAIEAAVQKAQQVTDKPSIIAVRTIIGYGSPLADSNKVHGSAMGEENVRKTKEFYGADPDKQFYVPAEVKEHMLFRTKEGAKLQQEWNKQFDAYKSAFPAEGKELVLSSHDELPEGWQKSLPVFTEKDGALATRQAHGKALLALKKAIPYIFGGSADLASSNDMPLDSKLSFQPDHYEETNIWFGVREHGMGSILNGMAAHKGVRVYGGTFLTFSDYMKGSIRLAALTKAPVIYIFTHDSVGLGEDGPTHQPVEQVAALRVVPNLVTIRPGDANETVHAWRLALERKEGPVALILSRQKLPVLDQSKFPSAENVKKGAYVLQDNGEELQLILIATGSEVSLALAAQEQLSKEGISSRVVSMPSWELFEEQDAAYKESVLPKKLVKRISIEALTPFGWDKYVGTEGKVLGINRFGESGPGEEVLKELGFSVENVVAEAKKLIG